MIRGADPVKGISNDMTLFHACFVGAGAADATKATNTQYPLIANLGLTMVRTSIGLFVVTLTDITPQILSVAVLIQGTSVQWGKVKVALDTATKIGQINIFDGGGNLDDPETADTVILRFTGRNSLA